MLLLVTTAAGLPGNQAHVFPAARPGYLHPVHPAGCHGHAPATPCTRRLAMLRQRASLGLGNSLSTYRIGAYTLGECGA